MTSSQMMQILALNCLLNAYSMSVLAIDDIKFSDTQVGPGAPLSLLSMLSLLIILPLYDAAIVIVIAIPMSAIVTRATSIPTR